MDPFHQLMPRLQLPPRAPLRHPRAHVDHRFLRQSIQRIPQQVDGHDRHRLRAPRRMRDDVVPAAHLLPQVAPKALDHRRRVGLLDLDQHLPFPAVRTPHPRREVHPQQRQRHLPPGGVGSALHHGLLRTDAQRLHLQAGDPADQQARHLSVLHQVLEHHVVDRVGHIHPRIAPAAPRARQSPRREFESGSERGPL